MYQRVFIVTDPELGWDCIVAVYDAGSVSKEELSKEYDPQEFIIFEKTLETML